ncbi:hypothetical protein BDP81DRAFT_162101 [Colletotrichum phormii]|uniref:Uncharacterized protein n=1 Tax=Colletotrichum phormii TaxID=359342 RepID=A0AAJ0EHD9_9PEZI|nr:uncharacterized protein BDP81DRAFT_162101 [Colletotrichum phormii]KAK1640342.1 hypothetical protein BDP81DRAFT_162101 [Colletotrichum phormii]
MSFTVSECCPAKSHSQNGRDGGQCLTHSSKTDPMTSGAETVALRSMRDFDVIHTEQNLTVLPYGSTQVGRLVPSSSPFAVQGIPSWCVPVAPLHGTSDVFCSTTDASCRSFLFPSPGVRCVCSLSLSGTAKSTVVWCFNVCFQSSEADHVNCSSDPRACVCGSLSKRGSSCFSSTLYR